jgi:hypothetical protein
MTLRSLTAWGLVGACLALAAGCGDEPSGDGSNAGEGGDSGESAAPQGGSAAAQGGSAAPQGGDEPQPGGGASAAGGDSPTGGVLGLGGNVDEPTGGSTDVPLGGAAGATPGELVGGAGGGGGEGPAELPGPITVTVVDPMGVPTQGAVVVLYDAAGASPAVLTTDANGKASHDIVPGGIIDVLIKHLATNPNATQSAAFQRATIFEAHPGDDLQVRDTIAWSQSHDGGTVYFDMPAGTGGPFFAQVHCPTDPFFHFGGNGYADKGPLACGVFGSCLDANGKFDVVVSGTSNGVVGSKLLRGLTYANLARYSVDAWLPDVSYPVSVGEAPANAIRAQVLGSFVSGGISFGDVPFGGVVSNTTVSFGLPGGEPIDAATITARLELGPHDPPF